jgi:hypothetical protein
MLGFFWTGEAAMERDEALQILRAAADSAQAANAKASAAFEAGLSSAQTSEILALSRELSGTQKRLAEALKRLNGLVVYNEVPADLAAAQRTDE